MFTLFLSSMESLHLLAETVTGHHDPTEVAAWAAGVTALFALIGTLGKLALNKFDKFQKALIDSNEAQAARLERAHRDSIEMLQAAHAAQVEALVGITNDNQRAMTALTVQLDHYTEQMQQLVAVINQCPGVVWHRQQHPQQPPQIAANYEH